MSCSGPQLDTFVFVKVADGADVGRRSQRTSRTRHAEFGNVQVQDQAAFREQQAGFVNQLLGFVTVMLLLAVIIALFGIANTLGLSIFERTRELGLLRAVGMSRTQVKRMIRWESVIIAILGALFGIVIGIFFGWALAAGAGTRGHHRVRAAGGPARVLRDLRRARRRGDRDLPARRAAKLNVLESISYE